MNLFEITLNVPENSVTKVFVITAKGLEPAIQPPLVLETRMQEQHKYDTCWRRDL